MDAPASDESRSPQGPESTEPSASEGTANASLSPQPETVEGARLHADEGPSTPAASDATSLADAAVADAVPTAPEAAVPTVSEGEGATDEAAEESTTASEEAGDDESSAGTIAAADSEAGDKAKRKRKRKRKRKGAAAEGEAGEAPEGKKRESAAPFAHLFAGGSPKRHAFAVGEVVAGRVQRVEDGGIVVDLFGKALAVADEFEPREVPPMPEPPPVQATPVSAGEPTAAAGAAGPSAEAVAEAPRALDTTSEGSQVAADTTEATGVPEVVAPEATPAADAAVATEEPAPLLASVPDAAAPEAIGTPYTLESAAADAPQEAVVGEAVVGEAGEDVDPDATMDLAADSAVEDDGGGDDLHGEDGPKGPLPPVPVVPEAFGRPEPVKLGGIFKGRVGAVAESGHIVLLNRIVDRPAAKAAVRGYRDQRRRVEGLVFGFNRGGFDVLVDGIRAFCPASAMALGEIPDPESHVGRKYEFLLPSGKGGKDIVVSRRSILERQARKRAKELVRSLEPGQRFRGKVTSVRDFGLFVDIGGVEGLVHQSEISHGFGVKPSDVCTAGDEVDVQILRVGDPARKKKEEGGKKDRRDRVTRVSLSMKALLPDPWDEHGEAIAEGAVREGTVTRTTEFGAFIELAPSIEGLLHISEFGRDLTHANQAVAEGEVVHVIVERADRKARRISLSRLTGAELEDFEAGRLDPAAAPKNLRPGARITVRIDKADNRGVVVRVAGAIGRRARGFIPASETGTERGSDLRKRFPSGQDVEVKVIGQDRDGGLKCSIKALQIDEERKAVKDYRREASKQGFGTFGDLLKAKLGQ